MIKMFKSLFIGCTLGLSIATIVSLLLVNVAFADTVKIPPKTPYKVVLLQSNHTAKAKTRLLKQVNLGTNFRLVAAKIKGISAQDYEKLWQSADLLLLDGINPTLAKEMFHKKVSLISKYPQVKVIALGDTPDSPMNHGVSGKVREHIDAYFSNGGQVNYRNMMHYIDQQFFKGKYQHITAPHQVPKAGLYHPDYLAKITSNEEDFFTWLANRKLNQHNKSQSTLIGIAMYRSLVDYQQTQVVDALIRALQKQGVSAFGFFHEGENLALNYVDLLKNSQGKPRVNVIIDYRTLHYIEKRKAEFTQLGVPVIQALNYLDGDEAHFDGSHTGISANMTPFFLVMPESAGLIDSMMLAAKDPQGDKVVMTKQLNALVERAINYANLARKPHKDKKIVTFIWNYPPGEKNIGAAFLDVPGSLQNISAALQQAGYQVNNKDKDYFIQGAGDLLKLFYRDDDPKSYLENGTADLLPLTIYQQWFAQLPQQEQQAINKHWGKAKNHFMVTTYHGKTGFVIPRLDLGNMLVLPQGARSNNRGDDSALYHDIKVPMNHYYLALYLYAKKVFKADAFIHLGTHGSQEWLTGKERGLSVYDAPNLAVGNIPVFYPYIIDNVGEAMQAKRRGRATIISHLTPGFAKAGLYKEIAELAELVNNYAILDQGQTRQQTKQSIIKLAQAQDVLKDLKITVQQANNNFVKYYPLIQDYLHELSQQAQPLGVHTFGELPVKAHLITTIIQMLGSDFSQQAANFERQQGWHLAKTEQQDQNQAIKLQAIAGYQLLQRLLVAKQSIKLPKNLIAKVQLAQKYWQNFQKMAEIDSLLNGLDGKYIDVGNGNDPIRNPDAVPTGKNLIGFNPAKVPSKEAYAIGVKVMQQTINDYVKQHGKYPDKLAFSLWSLETMRHHGALEAQILAALGVKPQWNEQGNIIGTEIIPYSELKRPRIDVVITATGLYRDAFPNVMLWLAKAIDKVAKLKEQNNAIYHHAQTLKSELIRAGKSASEAQYLSSIRIFSNETGNYGTGLNGASLASDTWENDNKLAELYTKRMGYMFGKDEQRWSDKISDTDLYRKVLSGTDAVIFSRSSNLYALLTNDDPFQYFGGIGLAVRNIDGKTPEMIVSNLRRQDNVYSETMAQFLNKELRSRYFHPRWIKAMQDEGYAGATAILDRLNNLWGWEVMTPDNVRDDQWQTFFEIYVNDKYQMHMREFFEQANSHALAQMIERMLEAERKDYWQTDDKTIKKLVTTYQQLAQRYDVHTDNEKFSDYVNSKAIGFGLQPLADLKQVNANLSADIAPVANNQTAVAQVQGQKLEKQPQTTSQAMDYSRIYWILALLLVLYLAGILWQLLYSDKYFDNKIKC